MVFPLTPLPIKVEMYTGTWVDITSYAQSRAGISITRGRADEAGQVDAGRCTLSLNNRDGRFSPRNPSSPYYGVIGRNTPVRVSIVDTAYLQITPDTGTTPTTAYVSTPDAASLDITGDLDIRFDADLDSWRESMELVSKWVETGNQRSYRLSLQSTGHLSLARSTDGIASGSHASTVPVPIAGGRIAVRATIDVNNGAGGRTSTFYTAPTIAGPWTQLGDASTTTGAISIFSGSAPLRLVDNPDSALYGSVIHGKVFAAQVLNGIAGTVAASPDFTIQASGATSFADTATPAKTWTLNGDVLISDRSYRFWGEASAFPQKWDTSGTDVWVPAEVAGIMRRLGQGAQALPSAWRRVVRSFGSEVIAYWSMEDPSGSTSFSSDIAGGKPLGIQGGEPGFASYTGNFHSSEPIATLNGARLQGYPPSQTTNGNVQLVFFLGVPATAAPDGAVIARVNSTGDVGRTDLIYKTINGGSLQVIVYDDGGAVLHTSASIDFNVDGNDMIVSLILDDTGVNFDWGLTAYTIGDNTAYGFGPTTIPLKNLFKATKVSINPNSTLDDVAVGHVFLTSSVNSIPARTSIRDDLNAFIGETAGRRVQRLCRENEITFRGFGDLDESTPMGYQGADTLLNLLRECEASDGGILFEPRDDLGIAYRPRTALYRQVPAARPDYAANQLAEIDPVEDDQAIRNDVTVTREGGASSRAVLESGRLSVQPQPDGVGLYDTSVTLSLADDFLVPDAAGWRLALGTIDEARYPQIEFNAASPSIVVDTVLVAELGLIDIGDRLVVENPPAWIPPEDISQLIQGYAEFLNTFERTLTLNCSPSVIYDRIGIYSAAAVSGAGQAKYSSDGSTLNGAHTSTTTSFSVATPSGPLWTTSASQHPREMIVAGEQVTVTATSGTTSPQTFTVVRSVNGIVKAQATGATIALLTPAKYATT